jgi:hypothetical protein
MGSSQLVSGAVPVCIPPNRSRCCARARRRGPARSGGGSRRRCPSQAPPSRRPATGPRPWSTTSRTDRPGAERPIDAVRDPTARRNPTSVVRRSTPGSETSPPPRRPAQEHRPVDRRGDVGVDAVAAVDQQGVEDEPAQERSTRATPLTSVRRTAGEPGGAGAARPRRARRQRLLAGAPSGFRRRAPSHNACTKRGGPRPRGRLPPPGRSRETPVAGRSTDACPGRWDHSLCLVLGISTELFRVVTATG